nr:MAG TPA: hypothetical protein [Caudoviricetes sp.]
MGAVALRASFLPDKPVQLRLQPTDLAASLIPPCGEAYRLLSM